MNKSPSLFSLLLVLAALAVFGFIGARFLLSTHSENTQEQLAIVWPGIAAMPANDRAFLVELAHTCKLTMRQPLRAEVVDCLRSVEVTPEAEARRERLLAQAPGTVQQR